MIVLSGNSAKHLLKSSLQNPLAGRIRNRDVCWQHMRKVRETCLHMAMVVRRESHTWMKSLAHKALDGPKPLLPIHLRLQCACNLGISSADVSQARLQPCYFLVAVGFL